MALTVGQACKGLPLWQHQLDALKTIAAYRKSGSDRAALIRLPTGAGKTGVMAVASRVIEVGPTLIIAPWSYLTSQLKRDIHTNFWKRLGVSPVAPNRPVVIFTPSTVGKAIEAAKTKAATLICTNHTLQQLAEKNASAYAQLRSTIAQVFVDEGHREPAPEWGRAVRRLAAPTVLFTATPYRNDHRYFHLDNDAVYRLPFADAVQGRFLRECAFAELSYDKTPIGFVDALLSAYDKHKKKLAKVVGSEPRVIVRCSTDADIRAIALLLKARGHSVVAVHERLGGSSNSWEYGDVPNPESTDATFWVHQNKLIEGIDDPRFAILGLYRGFGNARALVQQIGRILRNPLRSSGAYSLVMCHKEDRQRSMWKAFERYEERLGSESHEAGPAEVFFSLLQLQESQQYLDGFFRERFDPTAPDLHEHLSYPKSVAIFSCSAGFSLSACIASVQERITRDDYVPLGSRTIGKAVHVVAYGRCAASPLLLDQTFMELAFGFCVLRQVGDLLFHYDSEGMTPSYLELAATRVAPNVLERFLAGDQARISQVSLVNSDLSAHSIRRRILSARAMDGIAPSLSDSSHFCSTTTASFPTATGERVRRYLGFTRGRVSQPSGGQVPFSEWLKWTDEVASILTKPTKGPPAFLRRYASYVASPSNPVPTHILLDLDEALDELTTPGTLGEQVLLEDRAWDVSGGAFACTVAGKTYEVRVVYRDKRFELDSPALAEEVVTRRANGERSRNLVSHLNIEQAFRIVTDSGLIYANGQFYQPRIPLWGPKADGGLELFNVIIGCDELADILSEKGSETGTAKTWPKTSLFEFIDRKGASGLLAQQSLSPDLLVCDDLGNEVADFIAVQKDPDRVVLIHAKCGKAGQTLSASAFHDVCSQAVKNLGVLSPQFPSNLKKPSIWNHNWKQKGGFAVESRIRTPKNGMTAAKAWELIQDTVRRPSTTREVWIVMGNGMSRSLLEPEWKKKSPQPQVIQLIYLLQSTWNAVSSIGGVLKVFCKQ